MVFCKDGLASPASIVIRSFVVFNISGGDDDGRRALSSWPWSWQILCRCARRRRRFPFIIKLSRDLHQHHTHSPPSTSLLYSLVQQHAAQYQANKPLHSRSVGSILLVLFLLLSLSLSLLDGGRGPLQLHHHHIISVRRASALLEGCNFEASTTSTRSSPLTRSVGPRFSSLPISLLLFITLYCIACPSFLRLRSPSAPHSGVNVNNNGGVLEERNYCFDGGPGPQPRCRSKPGRTRHVC